MDPLSDVLSLLKPRSHRAGGFDAGGGISIRFPAHAGIKCYAVVSGACWLRVEGVADPVHLRAGDCVLLPRGRPFSLASDLDAAPVDVAALLLARPNGSATTWNGGGAWFIAGGHFVLDGDRADTLLGMLPPVVHLREPAGRAALRWSIGQMMQELREPQPGSALVVQHLAHMMLVQALRLHLADGLGGGVGWLFALADARMRAALAALHADPARGWTLQALARCAGMSRTSFAQRFRETVGTPPLEYLARWRMLLAGARLRDAAEPVSAVALSLGYGSESAFSTAFKRIMGCSPRQYGRAVTPPAPAAAPRRPGALPARGPAPERGLPRTAAPTG